MQALLLPLALANRSGIRYSSIMKGQFILGGCAILLGTAAFSATPAKPDPVSEKVQLFKDWAVGCDNGLGCQAVALQPVDAEISTLSLLLSRPAGIDGRVAIEISGLAGKADRYRLSVDGVLADTGEIDDKQGIINIVGSDAMKVSRLLAKGKLSLLSGPDGQELGRISLSGASAAMRYIDVKQGRNKQSDAIIARGNHRDRPKSTILPIVVAKRIKPVGILPDAGTLVRLSESSPCAEERYGPTSDSAFSLGEEGGFAKALVLLSCGSGAYNYSVAAYIARRDGKGVWGFAPARFDSKVVDVVGTSDVGVLVNADWASEKQLLTSYNKGRGIGDCGTAENYIWDGSIFRLVERRIMDECRGSLDWITVWRAQVKMQG
jgi:hypothetical protein